MATYHQSCVCLHSMCQVNGFSWVWWLFSFTSGYIIGCFVVIIISQNPLGETFAWPETFKNRRQWPQKPSLKGPYKHSITTYMIWPFHLKCDLDYSVWMCSFVKNNRRTLPATMACPGLCLSAGHADLRRELKKWMDLCWSVLVEHGETRVSWGKKRQEMPEKNQSERKC